MRLSGQGLKGGKQPIGWASSAGADRILDIEEDRLHFSDKQALDYFLQNVHNYYEQIIDFFLDQRHIFRILMLESLTRGKRSFNLFNFLRMIEESDSNPIYQLIKKADSDFKMPENLVLFKFFFGLIPILSFALYYDDWKKLESVSDEELRCSFIRYYEVINQPFISGSDVILTS